MEILVGNVKGKVCCRLGIFAPSDPWYQIAILIDDMCDTGKTLDLACKTLVAAGASKVYALVSHGQLFEICPREMLTYTRPALGRRDQNDCTTANRKIGCAPVYIF